MEKSQSLSSSFLSKFNALPDELKKQAMEFIDKLFKKTTGEKKKSKRKFGSMKGKIIIKPGFDDYIELW